MRHFAYAGGLPQSEGPSLTPHLSRRTGTSGVAEQVVTPVSEVM